SPGASEFYQRAGGVSGRWVGIVSNICDLHRPLRCKRACERRRWRRSDYWNATPFFSESFRHAMHRNTPNEVAFTSVQGPELGSADAYRVCQDGLKRGFQTARRRADNLQYLRSCCQLLQRLIALAYEPFNIYFFARSEGTATACGLWRKGLAALRFNCFATCFGAPSHCLPRGSGEAIVSTQSSISKGVGCETNNVRFGSKADVCTAPAHVRFAPNSDRKSRHAQMVMSALHLKADMCSAL